MIRARSVVLLLGVSFGINACGGGCSKKKDDDSGSNSPLETLAGSQFIDDESKLGLAQADLDAVHKIMSFVVGFDDLGENTTKFASGDGTLMLPRALVSAVADPKTQLAVLYVNPDVEEPTGEKKTKFEFANLLRFRDVQKGDSILGIGTVPDNDAVVAETNKNFMMLVTDKSKLLQLAPGWTGVSKPGKYAIYKTTGEPLTFIAGRTEYCKGDASSGTCAGSKAVGGAMVVSTAAPFVAFSEESGAYAMPNVPGTAVLAGFHKANQLFGDRAVAAFSSDASKNVKGAALTGETKPLEGADSAVTDAETGAKSVVDQLIYLQAIQMAPEPAPAVDSLKFVRDGTAQSTEEAVSAGPPGKVSVVATFAKPVNPASVTKDTFYVTKLAGGTRLDIAPVVASDGKSASITFPELLAVDSEYEANLTSGVVGKGGATTNPYDPDAKSPGSSVKPQSMTFKTKTAPYVDTLLSTVTPYPGSGPFPPFIDVEIQMMGTFKASNFVFDDGDGTGNVTMRCVKNGNVIWNVLAGSDLTFHEDTGLLNGSSISYPTNAVCEFRVLSTVTDADGVPLQYGFGDGIVDSTNPYVSYTSPTSGDSGVLVNFGVEIALADETQTPTLTAQGFTLSSPAGEVTTTMSGGSGTYVFTPTANLAPGTTYTVTIDKDEVSDGTNGLVEDYTFTFTTEAAPEASSISVIDKEDKVVADPTKLTAADVKHLAITFTREVLQSTIYGITVVQEGTTTALEGTLSLNTADRTKLTFTPTAGAVAVGASYVLTIPVTVTDDRGNALKEAKTFTFRTVKPADPARPPAKVVHSIGFEDFDTSAADHVTPLAAMGIKITGHGRVVNGYGEGNNYTDIDKVCKSSKNCAPSTYQGLFPNSERKFLYLATDHYKTTNQSNLEKSTAEFSLSVPATAKSVVISYSFVSAEYSPGYKSTYNDAMTGRIVGETTELFSESVNGSQWYGFTEGDNSTATITLVGATYSGQVGKSGIKAGSDPKLGIKAAERIFDISKYAGKPITLQVAVSDVGDKIITSAVLIDYIDFRTEDVATLVKK